MPLFRRRARFSSHDAAVLFWTACLLGTVLGTSGADATVPNGFQDLTVASGIGSPSVLAPAPDGRLFVGEKASGKIRVIKNGSLLAAPFADVNAIAPAGTYFDTYSERGLLGIAFDPAFATTQLVYVYFTLCKRPSNPPQPGTGTCQQAVNRIVRFQASGDTAIAGSATIVLDDIPNDAGNHNGGWIGFGPTDGKLYVAVGDGGARATNAQDMTSLNGKLLRVNSNGTVPADNPFAGQGSTRRGEIWALGLRNPYRCRFRADGRLLCADVGQDTWEEIDVVFRGANYGWPITEGPFTLSDHPDLTPPIHWYAHNGSQAAIIGGDFGDATAFPGDYQQSFFFADFARGFIRRAILDDTGTAVQSVVDFATGLGGNSVTDVVAAPDGALYYASYGGNAVRKIVAVGGNRSPVAQAAANPASGAPPLAVQLSSAGSTDPDGDALTMTWNFGDGSGVDNAPNPRHTYASAGSYTVTLTVSDGKPSPGPDTAQLTITVGTPPVVAIDSPTDGAVFRAGDTITLRGSATDAEDGPLPASALHWQVVFHHDEHVHPFIDDLAGTPRTFDTATTGESSANVAYEITLRATDTSGLTSSRSVVLVPDTSDFTLATSPTGLEVTLDGQTRSTPTTVTGVVGFSRTLGAPSPQTLNGQTYVFADWSDGGAQTHGVATAPTTTTYTARFVLAAATRTPTPVATATRTATPAPTPSRTATATPVQTRTATPMPASTATATPAATRTATPAAATTPAATPAPESDEADLTLMGTLIARVLEPGGSGNPDPEIIRDGDVPPLGSSDPKRQYDTFDGANAAAEDWIGYEFLGTQTFTRVLFVEGMHFPDGGWFRALGVQVRQNNAWRDVGGVDVTPPYAASGSDTAFRQYALELPAVSGDAIRLFGLPGGSAAFVSVAELRVFGVPPSKEDTTCSALPRLQQMAPNADYFRQVASDNSIAASDRQLVRNPGPTTICAIGAYLWNAGPVNGAERTTGRFHFEIWSDAGGVPGAQLGGDSARLDAAGLPDTQGDSPGRTLFWKKYERPSPTGDFWIVLQSDDLSGDQLAWSAARNDPKAHGDAAHDAFKLGRNLQTDFNFRLFVER